MSRAELEERAGRVLAAARSSHDPSVADASRVHTALRARLLAEPSLLNPQPPPTPGLRPLLDKWLLALGAGAAAGFAAGFYVAQLVAPALPAVPGPPAPPPTAPDATEAAPVSASPSTIGPDTTPTLTPVEPTPAPRRMREQASSSTRPRPSESVASVSPLKAELDGLRRAQELLHQGQPAWAIARLDELDSAGASAALLEERAATRAVAHCALAKGGLTSGAPAEAARRADEFARMYPSSSHLEQVRSSCLRAPRTGPAAAKVAPAQTDKATNPHE